MAIFGRKTSLVKQVVATQIHSRDERKKIIQELQNAQLKGSDAIDLLLHSDAAIREFGRNIVLMEPTYSVATSLIKVMEEQERSQIRGYLASILAQFPDKSLVKIVKTLLSKGGDQQQRMGWEISLNLRGELGVQYLHEAVKKAPHSMRAIALRRLLRLCKADQILETLIPLLKEDDTQLVAVAAEALSAMQDPKIVEIMMDCFTSGNLSLRDVAGRYLHNIAGQNIKTIRTRLLELLGTGEDSARLQIVKILLSSGDSKQSLIDMLRSIAGLLDWIRQRIIETLRTFGADILNIAIDLLDHDDEEVRSGALALVENFEDPRIVEPICRRLKDKDWFLRIAACDILGRLKDERAVQPLVQALKDNDTRWAAIDALARIHSSDSLKPLTELLRDPRQEVRLEVIQAFSSFADPRLLKLLEHIKDHDPSSEIRTRATEVYRSLSHQLNIKTDEPDQLKESGLPTKHLNKPMDKLLAYIREIGASDLHISVDEPPLIRKAGTLTRLVDIPSMDASNAESLILSILSDKQKNNLKEIGELDFCYAVPEIGRYRSNVYVQRRGVCASFRTIPNTPPTFADLMVPPQLNELLDFHQGIIVVSGPASSGKSTTINAIINRINETKAEHILTIEDPVEFVHPTKLSLINQRELRTHTESYASALRGALREDPDVIVIGDMRDAETVRSAMMAAETGHLVVASLHTYNAIGTVSRLITSFPPEEQPQVRMALSESLKYVVSQSLLPRSDAKGRVAIFEVLKMVQSAAGMIRDDKIYQLPNLMQTGKNLGIQTRDMALMDMIERGFITPEQAWANSDRPEDFEPLCSEAFLSEVRLAE